MSRLFGPMRQVGIVVRDIDKAMRHWVEVCGVGPWYYAEQLPMDELSWPVNYHEIRERALASGWQIGQEGDTPRGPFIYFLNEGHPGTIVEMAEATATRMRIFDQVREAALNWDGKDPIRMNWPQG